MNINKESMHYSMIKHREKHFGFLDDNDCVIITD
jgi:hypothetical protein